MKSKSNQKRKTVLLSSGLAVALLVGGYAAYDYYAGNHVEIEQVIPAAGQASGAGGAAAAGSASVQPQQLNGTWATTDASKVYFSVTTSKETVNFVGDKVKGEWIVDTADPSRMQGKGEVDISSLSSGNGQRDGHVKGDDYLQASAHPTATFQATSFEGLPAEWKEGAVAPFKLKGKLTVRGIEKEVTFDSNALYEQGALKLSGQTVVTFADFGMKNPHAVVLDTQNDLTVRLELVLNKQ
ncbi:YceI family protein [Paenibacillus flagellatus]|uniref:YceI family protein n=1 Tax=Paenibacillus flagellatus TaxID=2211139 RepID=A0A2V5K3A0_9BACL|nr:YceI family protein [Paenibacillus flagellatus]PYI52063.1 YceI family protein [Paenibacillus flagellatus]